MGPQNAGRYSEVVVGSGLTVYYFGDPKVRAYDQKRVTIHLLRNADLEVPLTLTFVKRDRGRRQKDQLIENVMS
jgi:hypothetical protein